MIFALAAISTTSFNLENPIPKWIDYLVASGAHAETILGSVLAALVAGGALTITLGYLLSVISIALLTLVGILGGFEYEAVVDDGTLAVIRRRIAGRQGTITPESDGGDWWKLVMILSAFFIVFSWWYFRVSKISWWVIGSLIVAAIYMRVALAVLNGRRVTHRGQTSTVQPGTTTPQEAVEGKQKKWRLCRDGIALGIVGNFFVFWQGGVSMTLTLFMGILAATAIWWALSGYRHDLYPVAIHNHCYMEKKMNDWTIRRMTSFYTSFHSFLGLVVCMAILRWILEPVGLPWRVHQWWYYVTVLVTFCLLVNSIRAWCDTMGLTRYYVEIGRRR